MGMPNRQLKLGRIGFLNVLPIFHPLESGLVAHPFEIVTGTPAFLNELMAKGDLDLGVVSSIEYARHPERYFMLPNLSISCLGPVQSVLLLSRMPISELEDNTVLVTAQSHTSAALLKILLHMRYGLQCRFETGLCSEAIAGPKPPAAVLVIGDEALRLRHHDCYPHRMDLGEAWFDWTGNPFVFAVWVIQKAAALRENGRLRGALQALHLAKEWGRTHLGEICVLGEKAGLLDALQLHDYYRCLNYDLNPQQQEGLQLFFQLLHRMGELDAAPSLNIYSHLACVA